MATIAVTSSDVTRAARAGAMAAVNLCTGLAGNADSTNIADRGGLTGGGALVITNVAGAIPTVTVNIEGSADGVAWFNIPYALVSSPRTFVLTALTITTAATTTYLLQELVFWRFIKTVQSANTNESLTVDYYPSAS